MAVDYKLVEELLDVVEAVQRVHIPFLLPLQQLALMDLEPLAVAAQEEIDARKALEAESQAKAAAEAEAKAKAIRQKEEEANNAGAKDVVVSKYDDPKAAEVRR